MRSPTEWVIPLRIAAAWPLRVAESSGDHDALRGAESLQDSEPVGDQTETKSDSLISDHSIINIKYRLLLFVF